MSNKETGSRSGKINGNVYDNRWNKYSQEVKETMTGEK
jgi:hypothetical protein